MELERDEKHPNLEKHLHQKMVKKGYERLERRPASGVLGAPHKSGHGGKFTWEGPAHDYEEPEAALPVDPGDPIYDEDGLPNDVGKKKHHQDDKKVEEDVEEDLIVGSVETPAVTPRGVARVDIVAPPDENDVLPTSTEDENNDN